MRTLIDLPKQQLDALTEVSKHFRISRAEAVRRAVADYLRKNDSRPGGKDVGFGLWKGRKVDALAYEARLRKEWDR